MFVLKLTDASGASPAPVDAHVLTVLHRLADRHKRSKAASTRRRLQITLAESLHLWTIAAYELLLWAKDSLLVHWLSALLSFLH